MSDFFVYFIPEDPLAAPDDARVDRALGLLRTHFPGAEKISTQITPDLIFFDPGENFERVYCSNCGANADDWWEDAMSNAHKERFSALSVAPPCCGVQVSLNDLGYEPTAGFAKFCLEIMNPDRQPTPELKAMLQSALGLPIRMILCHV